MKYKLLSVVAVLIAGAAPPAAAVTVAHWRWEDGPAGTDVIHTVGAGVFEGTITDVSGNGNHLSAWTQGGCCGSQYRADVPTPVLPLTGAANNFSVKNTGCCPGMFTDSAASNPTGVNVETMMPAAFTVEASFKPENGGFRTVVGRDAQNVATSDAALAALYLQAQPNNSFAIKFTDAAGNFHVAESPAGLVQGFDFPTDPDGLNGNWYNLAGVSDGTTLKLFVNNALVASTPIVSADPRLAIGTTSGGDWHAGEWSVGRGLYNGGHGDRAYGFIDEVRISDSALTPQQFLVPTALSLTVNNVTGQVSLKNDLPVPVTVDHYRIGSPMGALSLAGWNSLDDQNFQAVDGPGDADAIAGNSPGEGWDQAGGSSANQLIEQFVREEGSTIAAGQTLLLGNAFNTSIFGSGMPGDLTFEFGYNGGGLITSTVAYVGGGLSGNYDGDTDVDGNDFLRWQRGQSPNPLSAGDLTAWRNSFGAGGAAAAAGAVPEPAGALLAALTAVSLLSARKRT